MLKRILKNSISGEQLEMIFRTKQFVKDSNFRKRKFQIIPNLNHRIGNEVVPLNVISGLSIRGWRNLLNLFENSNTIQQDEFRNTVKFLILSDRQSVSVLSTNYVRDLFSSHTALYLEFLGVAYYANGEMQKAFETFDQLNIRQSSDRFYLYMSRCLMQYSNNNEVVKFLQSGINHFPDSAILLLSLANTYYRNGNTELANETLKKIGKKDSDRIQKGAHNLDELKSEISEAIKDGKLVRPSEKLGFQAYTEEGVRYYWETLFLHFVNKTRFQHGWSDLCYITEKKIEYYLNKYKEIGTVLNFGVFCAVPDFNVALRYPGIKFIGVDREKSTKKLNEAAFKASNISFHALDMLEIIYEGKSEVREFIKKIVDENPELMIFHARTATLIYPEALTRFYKSCAQLGVKYIGLYENMSLSRSEMKYYDFEDLPQDSIPYYSIMMIHNYKKYLQDAGYEIVEKEFWNYSELLWEGKDLYGAESWFCLGDGHIALLARLK